MAVLVVVCASASPAIADQVALRYDAAADCPDRGAFAAMVTARLGYSPFASDADRRAVVTLDSKRAHVRIESDTDTLGERSLRGATCADLAEATALALAVAIDAKSVYAPKQRPTPAPAPAPALTPAPAPALTPALALARTPAPAPVARAHAPTEVPAFELQVGAGVVAALGASPDPTAGATLQLGVRRGRASLDLEGRADRASHVEFGTGRVYASLAFAALVPCYHRGRFAGCGVVALGALRGRGEDFVDAAAVTNTFAAGGARVAWELPLADRISARLHADLLGAFARTSLQVSGMDVWTLPPVSGAVGVSAVGHFP